MALSRSMPKEAARRVPVRDDGGPAKLLRCLAVLLLPGVLSGAGAAAAQPYPARTIRVIVPNAPGGLADVSARILASRLSDALGQQVVVENRVGAGSTLGTAAAVRAPADGYTLLAVFDSHATNPHLFPKLEYDTLADLAPVSLVVRGPLVLVVNRGVPVKTVGDLVRLARARPR